MPIRFVRMVQFTRLIKVEGRLREFNFRKLQNPAEEMFNVNVCNERGDRFFFNMQKKDTGWKVEAGEFPNWVAQSETTLNKEIEDELTRW
jgi:hypothetical protein